jgi:hypothetical protein
MKRTLVGLILCLFASCAEAPSPAESPADSTHESMDELKSKKCLGLVAVAPDHFLQELLAGVDPSLLDENQLRIKGAMRVIDTGVYTFGDSVEVVGNPSISLGLGSTGAELHLGGSKMGSYKEPGYEPARAIFNALTNAYDKASASTTSPGVQFNERGTVNKTLVCTKASGGNADSYDCTVKLHALGDIVATDRCP